MSQTTMGAMKSALREWWAILTSGMIMIAIPTQTGFVKCKKVGYIVLYYDKCSCTEECVERMLSNYTQWNDIITISIGTGFVKCQKVGYNCLA